MNEENSPVAGASANAGTPPGWYPDNTDLTLERFWNGTKWTRRLRSPNPGVELERQDDRIQSLGLMLILLPPLGFILGVILAARGRRPGAGMLIALASFGMYFLWIAALVNANF